jgi:hypothetical protein
MAATGKPRLRRLARAAGARRSGRARTLALLVLAVLAVAAFLADSIVGFFLGFVAALVLIDQAWPATGRAAGGAVRAFAHERRARRTADLRRRLARRPAAEGRLRHLAGDTADGAEQRPLGTVAVELDAIVGSTEADKARAFDHCFRPPAWTAGRWQAMWMARRQGASLPPISVFRLGSEHYVRDGHHRVSVARALGETRIDAEVVELRPLSGRERRWYGPARHR